MPPSSSAVGSAAVLFRFGDAEVDSALCELRLGDRVVALEPRAFDVLLHLVRHRERVVTKEELLREVWGEVRVTENAVQRSVALIRRALGGEEAAQCIQTVQRRGYRFIAEVEERTLEATDHDPELAFVGRTVELARLGDALDAAFRGEGRVALLVGEPGIGKTRTAELVAERARKRGALVLVGRGQDDPYVPSFWLFTQIVRAYLEANRTEARGGPLGAFAKELEPILPELRAPDTNQSSLDVDGATRFRLFDSVAAFFRHISRATSLLILADDLQWADRASLELLRFLAPTIRTSRILVVATVREDAFHRDSSLADPLRALSADPTSLRVHLEGLSRAELDALMSTLVGPSLPTAWLSEAWKKTQGHPFFAREIAELWSQERDAQSEPEEKTFRLPDRLRDAIARRLAPLSADARRVLSTASLLGSPFESSLLAKVTGHDLEPLLVLLAEAEALRVIMATPERTGAFRFRHALVIEALKTELPTVERARLHRCIADALLEMSELEAGDRLEEIAHHYVEAAPVGAADRAVAFAIQAGERAMNTFGYENAETHFALAVSLLERYSPEDLALRAEVLIKMGRAQHGRGAARDTLRSTFRSAFRLAERAGSSTPMIDAALAFTGEADCSDPFFRTATFPDHERIHFLDAALARCPKSAPVDRARLLRNRALINLDGSESNRRVEWIDEARRITEDRREPLLHASLLLAKALILLDDPSSLPRRLPLVEQASELMRDHPHSSQWMDVHVVRAGTLIEWGRFDEADAEMEKVDAFARRLQKPFERSRAIQWKAMRAAMEGRFAEAEALIEDFETIASAVFLGAKEAARAQRSKLLLLQGRYEAIADDMASMSPDWPYLTAWRAGQARTLLELGHREEALAIVEELSADDFAAVPIDMAWLSTMTMLADLIVDLDIEGTTAVLYERLLPYDRRIVVLGQTMFCDGSVSRPLGRLAAKLGNVEAAIRHFEDALRDHAHMKAEPWLAITQTQYAEFRTKASTK